MPKSNMNVKIAFDNIALTDSEYQLETIKSSSYTAAKTHMEFFFLSSKPFAIDIHLLKE